MSKLVLEVPDSLKKKAVRLAKQEGVSLEQFVEQALAAKIIAVEGSARLAERARRGNRADFDAVLAKVSDSEADDGDQYTP